ncbi:MAG: TolC family protein [Bacteroidota bacterium]
MMNTENTISRYLNARFLLVVLIALSVPMLVQAQDAPRQDVDPQLEEYLQLAVEQNPELRSAYHDYLASLESIPQAGALPDPEVSFGYFISPIETRLGPQNARFSVGQMFPWFGTLGARKAVKSSESDAKFRAFQQRSNQLFYEIKSTWYELFVLQRRIAIAEEHIDILETLEELAIQNYEDGNTSQADVLQAQIELDDVRVQLNNLLEDHEVLRRNFAELLNTDSVDLPDSMSVSGQSLPDTEEKLQAKMIEQNPELGQLEAQQQASREAIQAAKLDGRPKFGVGMEYILTGHSDMEVIDNGRDAMMVRATVQIPLYRGKYRAQKKQAELQNRSVQQQQSSRENRLQTQFEESLRDYKNAERDLENYTDRQIERTRQAIDVLTEDYASADTDFQEILGLQRRLLDYQEGQAEAIGRQNKSVARIEMLAGTNNLNENELTDETYE